MTRILTIIILTFIVSCSSNNHWRQFKAEGLPDKDDHYEDIIFSNDSVGYIGGHRTVEIGHTKDRYIFTERTILYKTKDKGKSWKKLPLDYKGSISKIFCFNDTLITLQQFVTADTTHILKSTDGGNTWGQILTLTKGKNIGDIYFTSPDKGFISIGNSQSQYLLEFNNNKWDTILKLNNENYGAEILKDRIVSLIIQESGNASGALITNMKSQTQSVVKFDKPYYIASSTKSNNNLYLATHDSLNGKILKLSDNKIEKIELVNFSNYFPEKIFIYNNTIMVIAYRQKDVAFLGVIHSLLISHDHGQSWTLEEFLSSMSPEPAFMYKDNYFISSCLPPGFIQIRQ